MKFAKLLYKIKRAGNSVFTYNCASCGVDVRGKCLCDECNKKLQLPNGDDGNFAYYYTGPARRTMLCYKFGKDYEYCFDTLCDWLLEAYSKIPDKNFDFVIPVPSFSKNKSRFYYLAQKFALMANLPFGKNSLCKVRKTKKQHKISPDERRTNLIDAFSANSSVCGKNILLVDDIFTTGSTVKECSNALFKAGAAKVTVLTIFKTEYEEDDKD